MHFFTALITTLLLAGTGTLAIILPDNFTIIEIVPFDPEYLYKEAQGNPNVPLVNASIRCSRDYKVVLEKYEVIGEYWHGVSKKQIKDAAAKGGLMTGWKFESWEKDSCDSGMVGRNSTACPERAAGWRAKVSYRAFGRCRIESNCGNLLIFGGDGVVQQADDSWEAEGST